MLFRSKETNQEFDIFQLEEDFYYYNLNCKHKDKWCLSKIVSYNYYKNVLNNIPHTCRCSSSYPSIPKAGWHLSYFGDAKFINNKITEFAHQEFNDEFYKNEKLIEENINNFNDLYYRDSVELQKILISENDYLPPYYEKYLKKFIIYY